MIEQRVWTNSRNERDLDDGILRGEPSHIHLPRRRRLPRPDDSDNRAPRDSEERRGQMQAASTPS